MAKGSNDVRISPEKGENYNMKRKLRVLAKIRKWVFWNVFYKEIKMSNDLVQAQCSDGNWNCNSYMHGLANGMRLIESIFHGDEGELNLRMESPKQWLDDLPDIIQKEDTLKC